MSFNYIGSKKSLIDFINIPLSKIINKNIDKSLTLLDGFAGTGIVGSSFKLKYNNLKIIANDLEYYSYIINYSLLLVPYSDKLINIINIINDYIINNSNIELQDNYDLITKNYTPLGDDKRMYWTIENGIIADYCYYIFNKKLKDNDINNDEYIFLIASLLCSMDKIANTTSVYGAYLKKFKSSSIDKLFLIPIHINKEIDLENKVYNYDINNNIILEQYYDIVYLDPPYNQRQYSANYHPLNFIANYNNKLELYGKTGLIKNYNKSKFCQKTNAFEELQYLINNLKTKNILLSYNNEGIINYDDMKEFLISKGKVKLYKKIYKKYKSNILQEDMNVYEYLFHLKISNINSFTEIIVN